MGQKAVQRQQFIEDPVRVHWTLSAAGQLYLVAAVDGPSDPEAATRAAYAAIARLLRQLDACMVHERVFGSLAVELAIVQHRRQVLLAAGIDPESPATYIEGNPAYGSGLSGVIVEGVVRNGGQSEPSTVSLGAQRVGRRWRRGASEYLVLENLDGLGLDASSDNSRVAQTRRLFTRLEALLADWGGDYGKLVRTWFYLDGMLEWYESFNQVRSERYASLDSARGRLPASTAIGGRNPRGAALVLDVIAARGPDEFGAQRLSNPGQLDAVHYGSAFARAAVLRGSNSTVIQISGTAAIGEQGQSLHHGDPAGQIECTLNKLEALLKLEGATLADLATASVFLKRAADVSVFWQILRARGMKELPAIVSLADVCREELLVEVDGEVVLGC